MMMPYTFHGLACRKKIFSAVLTGAILFIALLFSDCRAAILSLAIGVGLALGVYLWEKHCHRSILIRLCTVVVGIGSVFVILFAGRYLFRQFIAMLPEGIMVEYEVFLTPTTASALDSANDGTIQRQLSGSFQSSTANRSKNERILIWEYVFQSLKNNPTFMLRGCGLAEIPKTLVENGYPSEMYTHNQFLEILLGLGLPTLLLFIGWLLLLAKKCLQLGLSKEYPWALRILPVVILTMLICNMFEAVLLFFRCCVGDIFFFLAGYVFGLMEQRKSAES